MRMPWSGIEAPSWNLSLKIGHPRALHSWDALILLQWVLRPVGRVELVGLSELFNQSDLSSPSPREDFKCQSVIYKITTPLKETLF